MSTYSIYLVSDWPEEPDDSVVYTAETETKAKEALPKVQADYSAGCLFYIAPTKRSG